MADSVWFPEDGEAATRRAAAALARRGFDVVRSFDLHSAMAGEHTCACPHHGTAQCTCQYVVLLAYSGAGAPIVITLHSRDDRAELRIVEDANAPVDPSASRGVLAALAEAALAARGAEAEAW